MLNFSPQCLVCKARHKVYSTSFLAEWRKDRHISSVQFQISLELVNEACLYTWFILYPCGAHVLSNKEFKQLYDWFILVIATCSCNAGKDNKQPNLTMGEGVSSQLLPPKVKTFNVWHNSECNKQPYSKQAAWKKDSSFTSLD